MKVFLVVLFLAFSSEAVSADAERGVVIGAKCDEIRIIESRLNSMELSKDKNQPLIGFSGVHRNLKAKMIYSCSEERWDQLIKYGSFSAEEAHKEAISYLKVLEKKFGRFTKLIDTMNILYRVVAWLKDRDMYNNLSTWWVRNNNGNELALQIEPALFEPKVGEKKWNVVFSASTTPTTKCIDSKCEKIQIRGLLD